MVKPVIFWAKKNPEGEMLPLAEHLLDVALCFRAMMEITGYRRRLEILAGRALDENDIDFLSWLAGLHDIGKINKVFQRGDGGHLLEGITLCLMSRQIMGRLPDDEDALKQILCSVFSHHGRIIWPDFDVLNNTCRAICADAGYRQAGESEIAKILDRLDEAFPGAGKAARPPDASRFWHAFSGLLTIADQIGSDTDTDRFPILRDAGFKRNARSAVRAAGLCSEALRSRSPLSEALVFGWPAGAEPSPMQRAVRDLPLSDALILVESDTGSGKTEAALMRFRRLAEEGIVDSLYFGIPTRSSAVQIQRRVNDAVGRLWGLEAALAVPGYLVYGEETGARDGAFGVSWTDDGKPDRSRWAVEAPRKYLAARIGVGTIDQALFAAISSKWSNMRSAALAGALLVIDEVHASDTYMSKIMIQLIRDHLASGGHVLLMSATLSTERRSEIFEACGAEGSEPVPAPYPAITSLRGARVEILGVPPTGYSKSVRMEALSAMTRPADIARICIRAARDGGRVLVIRNSVLGVQQLLAAIEAIDPDAPVMRVNSIKTGHHSRYAAADRKALDAGVEAALGKKSSDPVIVVGTQTLEQSLDIDADLLITDVCPVDVLLQRIGRLHRHPSRVRNPRFAFPTAIVLHDPDADERTLRSWQIGRERAYPDLPVIREVLELIEEHPAWDIPEMNRLLVDRGAADHLMAAGKFTGNEMINATAKKLAEKSEAGIAMLDRTPMMHEANQTIGFGTRLGTMPVTLELDPPIRQIFGTELIEKIDIPCWMLAVKPSDDGIFSTPPVATTKSKSPLSACIFFGGRVYDYTKDGLTKGAD